MTKDATPAAPSPVGEGSAPLAWLTPRLVAGVVLVLVGTALGLEALELVDPALLAPYFPLGFTVVGLAVLVRRGSLLVATLLVAGGLWGTLKNLGLIRWELSDLWPLALIALGLLLLRQALTPREETAAQSRPRVFAFLSRPVRAVEGTFGGGEAVAFMGGAVVDLRQAEIAPGSSLTVFAMWGGIEVLLDPSCAAIGSVFPVMGAYDDATRAEGVTVDAVRIRGAVLMGGIEVRNRPSEGELETRTGGPSDDR